MDDGCLSCGRDTGAGTALCVGRKHGRNVKTRAEGYLCEACQPGSAAITPDQQVPLSGRYVVIDIGNLTHG